MNWSKLEAKLVQGRDDTGAWSLSRKLTWMPRRAPDCAESPFGGPFHIHGSGQIIPPDYPITPYANQIVFWQGQAYLLGTVWNDEQDFICDPIPVEFTETDLKISG